MGTKVSTMSSVKVALLIFLTLTQDIGCYAANCDKRSLWESVKETVSIASENEAIQFGAKTAAMAGAAIVGLPVLASAAGFGAAGIAAGSIAAGVQSAWFGGAISGMTGGLFATMQSVGVVGLGASAKAAIVAASGAALKAYDSFTEDKETSQEITTELEECN